MILRLTTQQLNLLRAEVRKVHPKTFYNAFSQSTRNGLEFIGFFHSHPASANPSAIDLEFMRLWGEAVWLIFSSTENRLAAFQMVDGKVNSVNLKAE